MIETGEILQTMAMIQEQNFDIRTITLGINLLDCSHPSPEACAQRVYDKICRVAKDLVRTGEAIERELGIPIVNKRISVTPVSLICQGDPRPIAKALDRAAKEMGVNFLGGYSALMHKGATLADERLLASIPEVLSTTERLCSSVNVGSTRAGINMNAVREMGEIIKKTAALTADTDGLGCAKLVVFCNAVEDNPFMAGAFCGVGEPECAINVGVSGPGVVKRALEIRNFVPENYWEVQADFGGYRGTWIDKDGKTRIPDEKTAKEIVSAVTGREGEVLEVSTERKRVPPPLLYDLTTLQREANARYGFTAQKTLNLAQALYEKHKLLTYPRTDSRYLSHDMRPKVQGILKGMPEPLRALVLSPDKAVDPGKRVYDDAKLTDHHAIIPTGRRPGTLTADEQKLYEMVARQLIAAFYPDMEYDAMSAVTGVGEHKFLSRGRAVIAQGWQAANPPLRSKPKKGEEEQALPQLQKGQRVPVKSAKAVAKKTTPPSPYTENTLLAAMENAGKFVENEELRRQMKERGLGTPATRAAIIERLIAVDYVRREKKALIPTDKGIRLIAVAPEQLSSPETTGRWEKGLSDIAAGKMDPNRFMQSIRRYCAFLCQYAVTAPPQDFPKREFKPKPAAKPAAKKTGAAKAPAARKPRAAKPKAEQ